MTVPGQFGGGPPSSLYVQAQRPPDRPAGRRAPTRASTRRGCLLWLLALVVAVGGAAVLLKKTVIDPPPAAAARVGGQRTAVTGGGYRVALYDKAEPTSADDLQISGELEVRGDPPLVPLAAWRMSQRGWTETVWLYRAPGVDLLKPGQTGGAAAYALAHDWDIAGQLFNRNRGSSRDAPSVDGLPMARLYTAATNTRWGRFDPDADQRTFFHTRMAITSTTDGKAIVVVQLTWDDDHRPPDDEIDLIRRSIRPA